MALTERALKIYRLLMDLVRIPSVTGSEEEGRILDFIHEWLSSLPYYQAHPSDLIRVPSLGEGRNAQGLLALLRAVPKTPRTVILTGHVDVVDVDVYGPLKEVAFDPESLMQRLKEGGSVDLSQEAKQDLESGRFLFGRGVLDMKAGIALQMDLLAEKSCHVEDLPCNLLFAPVFDEENASEGMRSILPRLVSLQEEGLDYIACINSEPCDLGSSEENVRYLFLGTVGKIMPVFLCVGREAHTGEYFKGLNSTLIASMLALELEGNPTFSEIKGEEAYPPPCCLRMRDLQKTYSVTLPERTVACYSLITVGKSPERILDEMKRVAKNVLEKVFARYEEHRRTFYERVGRLVPKEFEGAWRVLTYEDLLREVVQKQGEDAVFVNRLLCGFLEALPLKMDVREKGVALMEFLLDLSGEKGPLILLGFLPPFNPHRGNLRKSTKEKRVLEVAEALINEAKDRFGEVLQCIEYFGGITDLSYLGFQGEPQELEALAKNLPGWGTLYYLPMEALTALDVPVLNIGPAGKDAHKNTERLEIPYSLEVVPELLREAVDRLAQR